MAEPNRLDQVLVEPERAGDRPGDLGDLQRVGQPGAVVIAERGDKHLGLVLEPAEWLGVDNSITIALEVGSHRQLLLCPLAHRRIAERRQRREPRALFSLQALTDAGV